MNFDFLKDIGRQLLSIWNEIKVYQKFTVIMVAFFLLGMLSFLVYNASSTRYSPLFPQGRVMISDAAEIKEYLDSSRVVYKIKGDALFMVPSNEVHRIRMDLAAIGLPKLHTGKGFELFDTSTWIKGEKELQILEMRALKGELERDIAEYENIKGSSVILDIAPPRPFGGSMYKTKSSVILSLMPGARLSSQQLRAITFHIAGAVRGLQPNMVAISDTTGKLYQAIDPDGETDLLRHAEVAQEERLKSKVDGMLALVVGHGNYYTTVQVVLSRKKMVQDRQVFSGIVNGADLGEPVLRSVTESSLEQSEQERSEQGTPGSNNEAVAGAVAAGGQEILNRNENRTQQYRQMAVPVDHIKMQSTPGKIDSISIAVLIDKTITIDDDADLPEGEIINGRRNAENLKSEIRSQLQKILDAYAVASTPAVDFVEFDKTSFNKQASNQSWSSVMELASKTGTILFISFTVLGMFWTFNRFWKRQMMQPPSLEPEEEEEMEYTEEPSVVEVEAMIEAVKMRLQSDPIPIVETIRDWLSEGQELDL
ncbi:MAG: flagellar M-ring protein FliF [Chlamydiales bacterium]|jgi:flagellar M-ring protein FliF